MKTPKNLANKVMSNPTVKVASDYALKNRGPLAIGGGAVLMVLGVTGIVRGLRKRKATSDKK